MEWSTYCFTPYLDVGTGNVHGFLIRPGMIVNVVRGLGSSPGKMLHLRLSVGFFGNRKQNSLSVTTESWM
jgi:hypothetical protein